MNLDSKSVLLLLKKIIRNITLKGSIDDVFNSVLLFFWTCSIGQYSKMRPLCFGSWLCSCLQVKVPTLLGPIRGLEFGLSLLSDPKE
jgi:hypothetical protein